MTTDAGRGLHEIRVGLLATEVDAKRVAAQIQALLCPDPHHDPPCPIPWSISVGPAEHDQYTELVEQARHEDPDRA